MGEIETNGRANQRKKVQMIKAAPLHRGVEEALARLKRAAEERAR
jgi:hypothetical protein